MPDPVFGSNDRVGEGAFPTALQSQLEGKDVKDHAKIISQYYADRENQLLTEARKRIAAAGTGGNNPPNPPPARQNLNSPTLTKEQVWNDPVKVIDELKAGMMSKEDFAAATSSAQKTIIRMAEQLSSNGKEYFQKYRSEILAIMNNLPADQQADPDYWDTAYNAVIGRHVSEIRSEAVTRATTISEPGQPAAGENEPPVDLSTLTAGSKNKLKTANDVVIGLGITPDKYRKAMKEMYTGTLGVTISNVGK